LTTGAGESGLGCWLDPPPRIAATMKTIARTTSPAIPFSAVGIGRRLRFGGDGWTDRDFGPLASAAFAAGTSALIGCCRATAGKLHAWDWLVGQLSFAQAD
jgi:hypothetical protein